MPRLPDKGFTGRAPQTAGSIPEIPPFNPQLAEMPGAMETSASLQRWWDLVKQRIEFNSGDVSKRINSISATFDNGLATLTAAITNEQTVRADADTALAQDITTVEATVNGLVASVETISTALATATNYLEARWTILVTAGPIVTGMTLFSADGPDTDVSYIAFQADRFQINTATGGNQQIFSATATEVKLGAVLTVDLANTKMFIGTGTYGNANTAFYVDAAGQFSLLDKLKFDGTTLNIGNSYIGAAGEIILGTANDVMIMTAADATYRMWIGNATAGTATFSVTKAGALFSTSGTIGGFTISTNHLRDNADTMGLSSVLQTGGGPRTFIVSNPNGAVLTATVTEIGGGIHCEYSWVPAGPQVYWQIKFGSTLGAFNLAFPNGTQTTPFSSNLDVISSPIYIRLEVQHDTGGGVISFDQDQIYPTGVPQVRFWAGDSFQDRTIAPFRVYDDGTAVIAGFSIGLDYIRDTANSFGLSSTVTGGNDVRFWAGATFANRATAPFRLYEDGSTFIGTGAQLLSISSGALTFGDTTYKHFAITNTGADPDFVMTLADGVTNAVRITAGSTYGEIGVGDDVDSALMTGNKFELTKVGTIFGASIYQWGFAANDASGDVDLTTSALTFGGDTSVYRSGVNTLAFSTDGVLRGYFDDLFNFAVTDGTVIGVLGIDTYGTLGVNIGSTTAHQVQMVVNTAAVWTFLTTGHLATSGGDLRKLSDDNWSPKLFDGTSSIEFQASAGQIYGRIDGGTAILLG